MGSGVSLFLMIVLLISGGLGMRMHTSRPSHAAESERRPQRRSRRALEPEPTNSHLMGR